MHDLPTSINDRKISLFYEVIISTNLHICEVSQNKSLTKISKFRHNCNGSGTDILIAEYGTQSKKTRLHGL